jgi:alkanesulfonate monooxygenase SsuD/methylene tetrahydromethanopterin reductase-like flavin-dependent oxidoreductase (luciferase family)
MVKVLIQLYPVIPAASEEERAALRPIGRNSERYQSTLAGWHDIVRAADELGLWGVSTIEHHFHSEGYEVGPNPGVLNAYWAAITKRVRVGQLGYVMSTHDPIRVAEEAAILDHLTRGRFFVGFARGYQSRWVNILGQLFGSRPTLSPSGTPESERAHIDPEKRKAAVEDDAINRRLFEEHVDLVLRAWTEDSIEQQNGHWQIPYPYDKGIADWPLALNGTTGRLGAPGEVDANRVIRRVSVVPAPYTKPHPPVFVSSTASPESIAYCGRQGFIPAYITSIKSAARQGQTYVDAAKESGRSYALGQNQCIVRWVQFGDTLTEAKRMVAQYDAEIWKNFYSAFVPGAHISEKDIVQSVLDSGLYAIGTVDDVRQQLVEQWKQLPAEYVVLIWHYAQQPKESVIQSMKLFMEHVKPALDELTTYPETATPVGRSVVGTPVVETLA